MNKKHLKKEYLERRKQAAIRATWVTLATVAGFGILVLIMLLKPIILGVLAGLFVIGFVWWTVYSERMI